MRNKISSFYLQPLTLIISVNNFTFIFYRCTFGGIDYYG